MMISINSELCNHCGLCEKVCPISILKNKVTDSIPSVENAQDCIACGHCVCICKNKAISNTYLVDKFLLDSNDYLQEVNYKENASIEVMRRRRSIRNYKDEIPSKELIQRIINCASYAPTAENLREVDIEIVTDNGVHEELVDLTYKSLDRMNRILGNGILLTFLSKLKPSTYKEIKVLLPTARNLCAGYMEGINRVTFDAPVLLALHTPTGMSLINGENDAMLLVSSLMQAATAEGLGTIFLGFATHAAKKDKRMKKRLGIPDDNSLNAIIALGKAKYEYPWTLKRKVCIGD